MTSDAKVGLLLGLVFIVIIAFLINGLPNFFHQKNADIKTSIASPKHNSLILGNQADEAVKSINALKILESQPRQIEIQLTDSDNEDIRYAVELPSSNHTSLALAGKRTDSRIYMVLPGDNLAVISKKVYGPDYGNKHIVVAGIYKANTGVLSSPDEVIVGQKLFIPALASIYKQPRQQSQSNTGIFERVKKFAGKNITAIKNAAAGKAQAEYVVQSGDSLWQIAAKLLGDGSRYHDILRLNRAVINDAEDITVGMRLKLPYH